MDMYDNEDSTIEERETEITEASPNTSNEALDTGTNFNSLSQVASESRRITEEEVLSNTLSVDQEPDCAFNDPNSVALDKQKKYSL